jgi:hypothetical protein
LTEGVQAPTRGNLQHESNGVVGKEVTTLLIDDLDSLDAGDLGYGQDIAVR